MKWFNGAYDFILIGIAMFLFGVLGMVFARFYMCSIH